MPKVKVTDPKGFYFNRKLHPQDAEIEDLPEGARLDAALHFKQVEVVKDKKKEKEEPKK